MKKSFLCVALVFALLLPQCVLFADEEAPLRLECFTDSGSYYLQGNKIFLSSPNGRDVLLYQGSSLCPSILQAHGKVLFFCDCNNLIRLNLTSIMAETILQNKQVTWLRLVSADAFVYTIDGSNEIYYHDCMSGFGCVISQETYDGLFEEANECLEDFLPYLTPGYLNVIAAFPVNSYYTTTSTACSHSTNVYHCKTYAFNGDTTCKQCCAFALNAFDVYYNRIGTSDALHGCVHNGSYAHPYYTFSSTDSALDFFDTVECGSHIRVTTSNSGNHSLFYIGRTDQRLFFLECNKGGENCQVKLYSYTNAEMIVTYPRIISIDTHNLSSTKVYYNNLYHKRQCSSCSGYMLLEHTFVTQYGHRHCTECVYDEIIN